MATNTYYVPTPTNSDYEAANADVIDKASKFSKKTHRLLSAIDSNTVSDDGQNNFKYLESVIFSTKDVKFKRLSSISMTEAGFISKVKDDVGCVYKILRFDRSHNIRTFEFLITYTQLASFGANYSSPIPITKQFKGTLLFTGCSIIRDTDTMEQLPLKLYAKYESIGDNPYSTNDLNFSSEAQGGPGFELAYTYDDDYVYLYIKNILPYRLIPLEDGEFCDISYAENKGLLSGESKENLYEIVDPSKGVTRTIEFSGDNRIWCTVALSLKDISISHDSHNADFVDFTDVNIDSLKLREKTFNIIPTNDGEQMVVGMAPSSSVNLEITPDLHPIRFGGSLLKTNKSDIISSIEKLKNRIKLMSTNIERVPFTIKTVIRNKGKYNIRGDYFIDSDSDAFGEVLINDIGYYDAKTDEFTVTEYVFDKNQTTNYTLENPKKYSDYKKNASDFISSLIPKDSEGNTELVPYVSSNKEILSILSKIEYDNPSNLDVFYNIAFVKSSASFDVIEAYVEFGSDNSSNTDDEIIYICKDGKVRICGFTDYDMETINTIDLAQYTKIFNNTMNIVGATRYISKDGTYIYYLSTDSGVMIKFYNIKKSNRVIEDYGVFDEKGYISEKISYIDNDDNYVYIGSVNGNVSLHDIAKSKMIYISSHFNFGDEIINSKRVDGDTILFISKNEMCTYNIESDKWDYEGDKYRSQVKFDNPYRDLKIPNIDYLIEKTGWQGVPVIQKDVYLYALGVRNDATDLYTSIYKRLNIVTGEVIDLPMPAIETRVIEGTLCTEGRYIYSIGGNSRIHVGDSISEENVKTYVSVFDTIENKWVTNGFIYIENNSGIRRKVIKGGFYPAVVDGSVYILKPSVTYLNGAKSALISGVRDYCIYKISFSENTFTPSSSVLSISALDSTVAGFDLNQVPININDKVVTYVCGRKIEEYDKFVGYHIYRIKINVDTLEMTYSIQSNVASKELITSQEESLYIARDDLFDNFSYITLGNEALFYCLTKFILYLRSDVNVAQFHAVYHNYGSEGSDYFPLVPAGEYAAWTTYGMTPTNTIMMKLGNNVIFVGGNADRVAGYLSLDSLSLIPFPRYYERKIGTKESSVLYNSENVFEIVPTNEFKANEITKCVVKDTVYILASQFNGKTIIFKKKLDDATSKISVVKDITDSYKSDRYSNFSNAVMLNIGDNQLLIIPQIGYRTDTDETELKAYFNAFSFDIETHNIVHTISDDTSFVSKQAILCYEESGKGIVTSDDVAFVFESIASGVIVNKKNDISFDLSIDTYLSEILRGTSISKKVLYPKPSSTGVDLYCKDTTTGITKRFYSIPNSAGYIGTELFVCGNKLYFTKGYTTLQNDTTSSSDLIISNELFKIDIKDIYDENGGDLTVEHLLISTGSSERFNPFIITRTGYFETFGNTVIDNSQAVITKKSSITIVDRKIKISDNSFIPFSTEITLSKTGKSEYNRFRTSATIFEASGRELFAIFGGIQSELSKTTTTIDILDVEKNSWISPISLPTTLSHMSISDNSIIGSTFEDIDNASHESYPKKIDMVCNNYSTFDFSIESTDYPTIEGYEYPLYAKYVLSEDKTKLFVIPINNSGNIVKSETIIDENELETEKNVPIVVIDLTDDTYSEIFPLGDSAYGSGKYIVAASSLNSSLILTMYNMQDNILTFWSYNTVSESWGIIKTIELPVPIKSIAYPDSVKICLTEIYSKEQFTAIKSGNVNTNIYGILTFISSENKNIYNIFIGKTLENSIFISNIVIAAKYSNNMTDIVNAYTSKNGFVYLLDETNNQIYTIYPDFTSYGFGVRNIPIIEKKDNAVSRTFIGDDIYTIYDNFDITKKNIKTGEDTTYSYNEIGVINTLKPVIFKVAQGTLYFIGYIEDNLTRIVFSTTSNNYKLSTITNDEYDKLYWVDNEKIIFAYKYGSQKIFHKFAWENTINDIETPSDTEVILENDAIPIYCNDDGVEYFIDEDNKLSLISTIHGSTSSVRHNSYIRFAIVANGSIYGRDVDGRIYSAKYNTNSGKIIWFGIEYNTSIVSMDDNIVIRQNDIIDVDHGYKYINARNIDTVNYRISTDSIVCGNYVYSIYKSDSTHSEPVIYTTNLTSHEIENIKPIVSSTGIAISDIPSIIHGFAYNGIVYLLDSGKIIEISTLTGIYSYKYDSNIKSDAAILPIKSKPGEFIINITGSNKYIYYDTLDDTSNISDRIRTLDLNNIGYFTNVVIFDTNINFSSFYSILKGIDGMYYFGKFNVGLESTDELVLLNKTDVENIDGTPIITNNGEIIIKSQYNCISFTLNFEETNIDVNYVYKYGSYSEETVYTPSNSLLSLKNRIDYETADVFSTTIKEDTMNEYPYLLKPIKWKKLLSRNKYLYRIDDDYGTIHYVWVDNDKKLLRTVVSSYDISEKCEIIDTETYFDSNTDETKFINIVDIVDNKLVNYYFMQSDSTKDVIGFENADVTKVSIFKNTYEYELFDSSDDTSDVSMVKSQLGTIAVILPNKTVAIQFVNTYGPFISSDTNAEISFFTKKSNTHIIDVADKLFVIGDNTSIVFCLSQRGIRAIVKSPQTFEKPTFSSFLYDNISLLSRGIYISDNSRIANKDNEEFSIYFNPTKNCSEINSRYIGVDDAGEIIDASVPIEQYDIKGINVNTSIMEDLVRSNENLLITVDLIDETSLKNITAQITAVSKLNTSKFIHKYTTTGLNNCGYIKAFTSEIKYGNLVRQDNTYYDNTYEVAIINSNAIKIRIDDNISTYDKESNTLPFKNEIIPIVFVYGDNNQYYTFVDVLGNVSTYDKTLKTFVDVSGFVDVKIPYYSCEALLFPSVANPPSKSNGSEIELNVWANGENNGNYYSKVD